MKKASKTNSLTVSSSGTPARFRVAARDIEFQVTGPIAGGGGPRPAWAAAGPAQHGLRAQDKLARAEWLRHVVVGASLQAEDPVTLFTPRGHHDHRDRSKLPDPLVYLDAVDARQHQVEHDQAGQPCFRGSDRLVPGAACRTRWPARWR